VKTAAQRGALAALLLAGFFAALAARSSHGATPSHAARPNHSTVCGSPAAEVHVSTFKLTGSSTATATFTLDSSCSATDITLASYKAPSPEFGLPQALYKTATVTATPGKSYTLTVDVPSCYYQVDLVTGSAIDDLTATNLYGARKIAFLNGGTTSCSGTPQPPPPCPSDTAAVVGAGLHIVDGKAVATFSIAAGCTGVQVSLATYRAPAATFSLPQTLYASATGKFDAGGPYTLTAPIPPCFWQVDLVIGPVLPVIDSSHLYGSRKVAWLNGGKPCTQPPPTTSTGTTTPPTTTTRPPTTTTVTTTPPPTTTTPPPTTTTTTTLPPTTTTTPPATTTTTAQPSAPITDVAITKTPNHRDFQVGDVIVYTLVVKNNGPDPAENVMLAENLPPQISLISVTPSTGTCSAGAAITCSFGTLAVNATVTITLEARAIATGTAVNTATVTTSTPETTTANNRATATVIIHAAFTPPKVKGTPSACASLRVESTRLRVGHATTVVVSVRDTKGRPIAGLRIVARGAGVAASARTTSTGVARIRVKPKVPGVVQFAATGTTSACEQHARVIRVTPQIFLPPKPHYTG